MKQRYLTGIATLLASFLTVTSFSQPVPALINYQGRLTDKTGAAMPPGAYILQFRIWNDPLTTASANLIRGKQQSLTIQSNGVFNVILGTGSSLPGTPPVVTNFASAFGGSSCFLGLAVAAGPSGVIANPAEILPRQQLLSVPFAITAASAVSATSVIPGAIGSQQIAQGGIQTSNLAAGIVTLTNLAPRPIGTNVGVGGIAVSLPSGTQTYNGTAFQSIANMSVTIQTTGRPVLAFLSPAVTNTLTTPVGTTQGGMFFNTGSGGEDYFILQLVRDSGQANQAVMAVQIGSGAGGSQSVGYPTSFMVMDFFPPPGQHTYQLQWGTPSPGGGYLEIFNVVLTIFEL